MDFIEKLFGISPDGGDGTVELLILIATVCAAALFWMLRKRVSKWPATERRTSK